MIQAFQHLSYLRSKFSLICENTHFVFEAFIFSRLRSNALDFLKLEGAEFLLAHAFCALALEIFQRGRRRLDIHERFMHSVRMFAKLGAIVEEANVLLFIKQEATSNGTRGWSANSATPWPSSRRRS